MSNAQQEQGSGLERLLAEGERFVAGWAADRIRSVGDRADQATKSSGSNGDGGDSSNGDGGGGGGGGGLGGALQSGMKDMQEGHSPLHAAGKAATTGIKDKVKQAFGKGGGGGGSKVVNIIEDIDVGLPVEEVWQRWNDFEKFNGFMKGVESVDVDQEQENKSNWKTKVAFSHRSWEATVTSQKENELLAWKSQGSKGSVDGVLTFHEIAPRLTKVIVVLEYHPSGFFEKTGNLWKAQGRRARLDLKHFRRYAMTEHAKQQADQEGEEGEEGQEGQEQGQDGQEGQEQGRAEDEQRAEDQDGAQDEDRSEDESDDDSQDEEGDDEQDRSEDEDRSDEEDRSDDEDEEEGDRDRGERGRSKARS